MDGGLCMGDNYFLLTNLLSEDERKVITSITAHIERGEKRAGIQQIAAENYLSTASIIKMCKRLGFDGYSELYYHLSRQLTGTDKRTTIIQMRWSAASASCCAHAGKANSLQPARAFPTSSARISSSACPSAASWPSATSIFTTT